MVDKPWEEGAIKVIRKAQVIPIYFHAKNSWLFYYFLKLAAPSHRKITFGSFSQKRRVIKYASADPFLLQNKMNIKPSDLFRILEKETYMLANPYAKESKLLTPL
jgi:hypothetical protein